MLRIKPDATFAEIESAIESYYDQWRRLVTHHDPQFVEKANQALQTLNQIRATLLNPDKRGVYDAGLGLKDTVSDLGLPETLPLPRASLPRTPAMPTSQPKIANCPQCGTGENPPTAKFCVVCRTSLVQICPKCGEELRWHYANCSKCGANIEEEHQKQYRKEIEIETQRTQEIGQRLEKARQYIEQKKWRLAKNELFYFEGLGIYGKESNYRGWQKDFSTNTNKPATRPTPICSHNQPEWVYANVLDQDADVIRRQFIKASMIGATLCWIGLSIAAWLVIYWINTPKPIKDPVSFLTTLVFGIVAAVLCATVTGVCGPLLYAALWAGRWPRGIDFVLAMLSPIPAFCLAITMFGGMFALIFLIDFYLMQSIMNWVETLPPAPKRVIKSIFRAYGITNDRQILSRQ